MKHTKSFQEMQKSFSEVYQWFSSLKDISLSQLPTDKTAHIIVDMINGFVKEGALSSKEVLSINNSVADFAAVCTKNNIPNIALADSHSKESVEFQTFPVHCLDGTYESEVTDEIKNSSDFTVVKKNSTNGFLEPQFVDIINKTDKNTFIVTGDCTDMCVIQFALTLKADFNRRNMESRVIVPYELTATCSMPNHEPELAEIMALYIMHTNGIETVKNIIAD